VGPIPLEPVGTPLLGSSQSDFDEGRPVGPTPAVDLWRAIYERRSVRRFREDPVPRDLIDQILHAGIWAPSSCNYQMWDVVVVDDPEVNRKLTELSLQMGNAPVNIVVSYGREFSEEGFANIQSASAMIQNMSLAAHALGLGTFWITQMGDAEKVREIVGLPYDRFVVAVLALGYPKSLPKRGPRRRPLQQVAHYNHYTGRPIPSSPNPEDWPSDLRSIYQRARVLNGLRHNKPRAWETRALLQCLDRFVPDGRAALNGVEHPPRWLDVLPCTGILTERMSRERAGFAFDVVDHTSEVASFAADRTRPRALVHLWPPQEGQPAPAEASYEVVSCFFRLEDLRSEEAASLVADLARWTRPGGRVLIGFVNSRSFHDWAERLRARRGGPRGVEYVLAPDPNIGPFRALSPRTVEAWCRAAGLSIVDRFGCQLVPTPEETEFRTRNFSSRSRRVALALGRALALLERLPGLPSTHGRFQFLMLRR
jgi:nitroreductase